MNLIIEIENNKSTRIYACIRSRVGNNVWKRTVFNIGNIVTTIVDINVSNNI